MLFIHGERRALIKVENALMHLCPFCNKHNTTLITVYSIFHHVFWIPLYPVDKELYAHCTDCGAHRHETTFCHELKQHAEVIRTKHKHPLFTYAAVLMMAFVFIMIVISRLL